MTAIGARPNSSAMVPTVVRSLTSSSRASCNGVADAGADLDLRAQELGADLAAIVEQGLLAFGEEGRGRLLCQVAAVLVDEEVFLFDADCETWLADRHGGAMWHNRMTACSRFASIG